MTDTTRADVIDLFAGFGWAEGITPLGLTEFGIDNDPNVIATRQACGHHAIHADLATLDPRTLGVTADGLIASPPCPDWSRAGRRAGRSGESGWLIDIVPTWVDVIRPRWVALEQVPDALPVWREHAELYRALGYSVWCGELSAERYGVPQTRRRAILMAHRDRDVQPPAPTHQRYEPGVPQGAAAECSPTLLGPGLEPWVSMADALGWHDQDVVGFPRRDDTDGTDANFRWWFDRPATTICGDPRVGAPGHRDREGGEAQFENDSVRVTVEDALVLQSFRPDLPVQGTQTARYRQVGNAVPPLLARAIVGALYG